MYVFYFIFALRGVWVETTQEDFRDGIYEHNLYATHRAYHDSLPGDVEWIPRWDFNGDGWMDAVVSNIVELGSQDPIKDSIYVYLGGPEDEYFLPTRRLSYPTGAGANVVGCDLNLDGYTDLILQNYRLYGVADRGGITLFWGTDSGPTPENYRVIGECAAQVEAVTVADLNRDGWLDIIHGGYPDLMSSFGIFWGDSSFAYDSVTILPALTPRHNFEVADLDKDGYYDIVVVNYLTRDEPFQELPNYIYWGGPQGYSASNRTELMYLQPNAHGLTVADFNKDGWLDLVFTGLEKVSVAYLYYGKGNRQFSAPETLQAGKCFGGSAAADINGDGWLDIVFFVGNAEDQTYLNPIWVYINDNGKFSEDKKITLGPKKWSMSGGVIADFNKDGHLDMFINDWISLGGYSGLLFGPDFERITEVPNHTDHHAIFWEVGNTYSRENYEDYISSVFDAGDTVNWDVVSWVDSCPGKSRIKMYIRTGDTETPDDSWTEWIPIEKGRSVPDYYNGETTNRRYIQYKASLWFDNAAELPVLFEVRIYYGPSISVEPDQSDSTYPGEEILYNLVITNNGFGEDVINVETQGTTSGWQVRILNENMEPLQDTNGDELVDVGYVSPEGGTKSFIVGVTPPANAMAGDADTTIVWVYSTNNSTVKDSAVIITVVVPVPAVRIYPDHYDSTFAGEPIRYQLTVENNGNSEDVLEITTYGTREGWNIRLLDASGTAELSDTDDDGLPDVGVVEPSGKRDFFIELIPPFVEQEGAIDSTYVVVHSSVQEGVTDEALCRTKVLVRFYGFFMEPPDTAYIHPGEYKEYGFRVINTGNEPDTIDLWTQGNQLWRAEILDAQGIPLRDNNGNDTIDTGEILPFDTLELILRVTPPAEAGKRFTGDTEELETMRIDNRVIYGVSSQDKTIKDTLPFLTVVIPMFNIHNYPNPFSKETDFFFSLPADGKVTLRIFNRAGEYITTLIENEWYSFGTHVVHWDGTTEHGKHVAPGIYLYVFTFEPDTQNELFKDVKSKVVIKKALCSGKGGE